jgi:hypothetical protein
MKGVLFATPSVENFLEGVMKTHTQDFLGKMEGFAIQGIQGKPMIYIILVCHLSQLTYMTGAAKNYKQRISSMHMDIRSIINDNLSKSATHFFILLPNICS